jgi:hypothetical protein
MAHNKDTCADYLVSERNQVKRPETLPAARRTNQN